MSREIRKKAPILAERVKELRYKYDMRIREITEGTDLNYGQVSNFLIGSSDMSPERYARLEARVTEMEAKYNKPEEGIR